MKVCDYLDIKNHKEITDKLYNLVINSLYYYHSERPHFSFSPRFENQKQTKIETINEFWNFLDYKNVLKSVPELKEALDTANIKVLSMALLVVRSWHGKLHSDTSVWNNDYRINWPIANCETAETKFFRLEDEHDATCRGPLDKSYTLYNVKDIKEEIGSYFLTRPVIFKFKIPHSVKVDFELNTIPRIILTIDFESETVSL